MLEARQTRTVIVKAHLLGNIQPEMEMWSRYCVHKQCVPILQTLGGVRSGVNASVHHRSGNSLYD